MGRMLSWVNLGGWLGLALCCVSCQPGVSQKAGPDIAGAKATGSQMTETFAQTTASDQPP